MRIITGTKKGMKLASPRTDTSRPITDRIKESLFNVLIKYDLIEDKAVADVFSGVGSMGLEALSRGASVVTFVEKDPKIIAILKQNIRKADFVSKAKIIRSDAFKIGAPVDNIEKKYSLIFLDPPYPLSKDAGSNSPLARLLSILSNQITENGIIVLRTHFQTELLEEYDNLYAIEKRKWGTMLITFFALKETK
jgi:16S rRNA (guanine(966)-N(2))-methyltransferase RsmD